MHGYIYCDSRSDCYGMDCEFEDTGSFCDEKRVKGRPYDIFNEFSNADKRK